MRKFEPIKPEKEVISLRLDTRMLQEINDWAMEIDIDYIIMALGSEPEEFVKDLGLELNKWGRIQVDEKNRTTNPKIFAGGDIAGAKGTVAWAARSGRDAAYSIMEYLK